MTMAKIIENKLSDGSKTFDVHIFDDADAGLVVCTLGARDFNHALELRDSITKATEIHFIIRTRHSKMDSTDDTL